MKYYLEITLLPNPDINLLTLWSKVFQQIHLGLVEMQDNQKRVPIGVSFPEYIIGEKYSVLGGKLRLFAQEETTLARLDAPKWLSRLSDYVHCTGIRSVPEKLNKLIPTPFIRLKSLSSDNTFCLWIRKIAVTEPSSNTFSSYGLSATSTVPEF